MHAQIHLTSVNEQFSADSESRSAQSNVLEWELKPIPFKKKRLDAMILA